MLLLALLLAVADADPSPSRFLRRLAHRAGQENCTTYAQCVGWFSGSHMEKEKEMLKACCQSQIDKAWAQFRDGMPAWGRPLIALGVVIVGACCLACLGKVGVYLCTWMCGRRCGRMCGGKR
mmetsp:Transcript_4495/g.10812  ORF Transcript_4495/g.10812 Transcript_4495/m.10812 type:complete len:122 (+) Transcript_4495:58-423(+)